MAGNQTIIAACQAAGATSTQYNTALMEFAIAAGATAGDLPTALFQAFTILGYTGSLSDMFRQWEVAGYPAPSPAYGYSWTIGQSGTVYGYQSGSYGDLTPTTAPHGDPDPIIAVRSDTFNYMYVVVAGAHGGTTVYAVIEGFNDEATRAVLFGDVSQWFGTVAGLNTYLAGQIGNTLGLNLYDTDPAV